MSTTLLLAVLLLGLSSAQELNPMEFTHHIVGDADNKFHVFWIPEDEGFTMELAVMTAGYAAIGFSPNGGMSGADIFLGFVNENGQAEGMVSLISNYQTNF